jgi:ATP-dependent DNA helicase 2 subunit 1
MNTVKCHLGKVNASEATLMLQIYKTIAPSTKSAQANLHSLTNLPLKTVSRNIDASTGKVLEDDEISTYIETLGRRVYLARKELNDLKQLGMSGEASITILYFIDAKALRPEFNCSSPYFLSADDKVVKGSAYLFDALLHTLMAKELIAVASFMLTKSGKPRMVALLPQGEIIDDDDGQQILPPGMNVISLPYLSELRHLSTSEHVLSARAAVTDEAVDSAISFMQTWQVENSRNIEDFEVIDSVFIHIFLIPI